MLVELSWVGIMEYSCDGRVKLSRVVMVEYSTVVMVKSS